MALDGTYSGLLASIQEWLDDTSIAAAAPDFVAMAEARFNRVLRTSGMEARATTTATSERITLPPDFRGMRAVYIDGVQDRPLTQRSLASLRDQTLGLGGSPAFYAIADDQLILAPVPDGSPGVLVDMIYFRKVPPLATAGTNWLLQENPDLYLTMSLVFAEMRGWNDSRLPLLKTAADEMLAEIARDSTKRQYGAAPMVASANVRQVRGGRC